MQKIICVSDLHSQSFKEIYDRITNYYSDHIIPEYIVLMGDYTDSYIYDMKGRIEVDRFKEVIQIAKSDDRIKLLLGNHDAHYLYGGTTYFSKNTKYEKEIKDIIETNINMFYYALEIGPYIFSHQGITKTLMKELNITKIEQLNEMLHNKEYSMFIVKNGLMDWFLQLGTKKEYDDYDRLLEDRIEGKQIVGHYTNRGVILHDDILAIENVNHGNIVSILF